MEQIYIQTYSVHQAMQDDFRGTLKKLSACGYTGVEWAGEYRGRDLQEVKDVLSETGLSAISAHVGLRDAVSELTYLSEMGLQYVVCPSAHMPDLSSALEAARQLNEIGKICCDYGMKYGYHNHTQEYFDVGGAAALDVLIENTDPDRVIFQLDVGWAACAGIDVCDYIQKYAGRFELIHAKECDRVVGVVPPYDGRDFPKDAKGHLVLPEKLRQLLHDGEIANGPMGQGIIDWKRLKDVADRQGTRAYIIEREYDYTGSGIFRCVEEDYTYLKNI